jgi:hypothetical protein
VCLGSDFSPALLNGCEQVLFKHCVITSVDEGSLGTLLPGRETTSSVDRSRLRQFLS